MKPALVALVLLALLHTALTLMGIGGVMRGDLPDADVYMRLVRIEDLISTGDWFSSAIARANWPYGDTLNWSRPVDVLILLCAAPVHLVGFSWHDALHYACFPYTLIMQWLCVLAILSLVRRLMGSSSVWPALPIALLAPMMMAYSLPGRADHHTLQLLCTLMTACALVSAHHKPHAAISAGIWSALGLWVSSEYQFLIIIYSAVLAYNWLKEGYGLTQLRLYALSLSGGAMVALLIERGPYWMLREYDKLSLAHLIALSLFAALTFLLPVAVKTFRQRILALAAVGALGFGAIMLTDPLILLGPRSSARAYEELHRHVMELRPIELTTAGGWADFCLYLLLPLLALMAWDMRAVPQKSQDAARWRIAVWPALVMTLLGVRYIRFLIYAGCFAVPVLSVQFAKLKPRRKIKAAMALALLPFAAGAITSSLAPASTAAPVQTCHLRDALSSLEMLHSQLGYPPVVIAPINHAPELLWRSAARVIGSSYYRNEPGVFDTHDFFRDTSDDTATARAIAARRKVNAVLLCLGDDYIPGLQENGLLKKLQRGEVPAWLEKMDALPEGMIVLRVK